ncbi:NADH-cytochrome b5 reductase, putative [Talaromyces stipitatus ATCC 10500]|uniref:NADH-cytochrome b5 reductase n=1 Tax=Talaromyces stipitatus (strain ATCC 10500 / CBS 375.48 / QM 6759 / NRRL 1006) TaxID=441959 RepID=B8MGQ1_TALSN|nr:NADH-cytochrome b5 reductase, putative [Talaromyces stipitatus ATCC 10500]EED16802.1 NADH-cytochrome b5 reductase, putative [Talaromyces stipitatus ATCC 10500]
MFARSAFRLSQPARQSFRKYSTEATAKGNNLKNIAFVVGALGVGTGVYRYMQSKPVTAEEIKERDKVFTGGDQGFVDLKLSDIEILSHNTKRYRFEFPDKEAVSGLHVASALITKYTPPEGKPIIRPYTPVSDEDTPGYLDLIVKHYPNGPMSSHLDSMNVGQRLDFKGPIPKYPWQPNKHNHIAMIAGGTGITPMYQLIRAIFKNPDDKTKVTLVYGNVGEDDILLKKELHDLENTYPQRFKAFYLLDSPPKEWTGGKGYVTKELLKTVLPEPKEENIKVFVCGPPGLYKAISGGKKSPSDQGELEGYLKELGYNKEQVYKF